MKIPFSPPYIDEDVISEVMDSLQSGWITTGPKVKALEEETAKMVRVPAALCINSATSGMMLALHWYGIGHGDEVIVPAYTYSATALAVMHIGATPVMVDVKDDFTIDPDRIREAITSKTKAIIPVDIAGWTCDYDSINALVNEPAVKSMFVPKGDNQQKLGRILVMSDAAHAVGAFYKGRPAGSLADISVFSYHAVKNVTTAEGGAICLNMPAPFDNQELYKVLRLWSLNGQTKDAFTKSQAGGWRYDIVYPGFKMNLPDVLAAIGLAQIRKYDSQLLEERKRIFDDYHRAFSAFTWAQLPPYKDGNTVSSCHLYPLRIKGISEATRDRMIELISEKGVAVNVHFIPMPMLTVFREKGYDISRYPVAFDNYSREISLPIYPQLNPEQVQYIIKTVAAAYEEATAQVSA